MSWASKRRTTYLGSIFLVLAILIGIPLAVWLYEPASCFDGKQNQEETAIDKGGSCRLLDEQTLTPYSVLWSRSFQVRAPGQTNDATYSAVAYIENPNEGAGVQQVGYRFGLYDERNVLVAERLGTTFIMPSGVTPVFQGAINTGNRAVVRTYFEFTGPLVWERVVNAASVLTVSNKIVTNTSETPRLTALVKNGSVTDIIRPSFVAVAFDTAGNAFAASETLLSRIDAGEEKEIVFTWPGAFLYAVGRVDVIPLLLPVSE